MIRGTVPLVPVMAALLAGAGLAPAQRLAVVSEFQRIRPDGRVVEADRVPRAREIVSPAVTRNNHATFRLIVATPPGADYTLYLGQNPDQTVEATLHQEKYDHVGAEWIPDELTPVDLPYGARLAEGQKVQTYLLDLWVPADAPVGRFRLEVQMRVGEQWIIYPMEVRVRAPVAGEPAASAWWLPASAARSDLALTGPLREFICGEKPKGVATARPSARAFLARNAARDLSLASQHGTGEARDAITAVLVKAGGYESRHSFCAASLPSPQGPEWWLRVRDHLYQGLPVR